MHEKMRDDQPVLIINKGSEQNTRAVLNATAVYFEEIAASARNGQLLRYVLRFKKVILKTQCIGALTSPFLTAVAIKFLSRGPTVIEDDTGNCLNVSWLFIVRQFFNYIREFKKSRRFLAHVNKEINRYADCVRTRKPVQLDPIGRPVYLRTDLTYRLQAGGSIGHIAGVLNNLPHCNGQPILLTSDTIATVDPTIEGYLILPENRFPSFAEMRYLDYNSTVVEQSKKILHSKRISFIYQRYSLNNYSGFKLSRYYKVPFVLEYNGSEIWVGKNWGRRIKNETVSSAIETLNLHGADLIVVVSHALRDEIEQRGVDPKKILVNPNGVNTETYSPEIDGTMIRDAYGFNGKTVIGFIGTFGRWHGAEVLIDAFGLLLNEYPAFRNNVALFYIGDGMTMPLVRQRMKALNIADEVTFAGVVPQAKGPEYLAACDILASPHIPNPDGTPFFGSPTKLFEYMAMGKGIVASRLGQIKDVLKHRHTAWMVRPADPEDLMTGLRVMVENPELRKQLGDNARSQAVYQHTWKKHTQNIIDALNRLLNGD